MKKTISRGTTSNNDAVLNCNFNFKNKRRSQFACKKLECPYCGPRIQEEKKLAVQNRIEDHSLWNLVTLTSPPSDPLFCFKIFKELQKKMVAIFSLENYKKEYNTATDDTYHKHLKELYEVERFYIWFVYCKIKM